MILPVHLHPFWVFRQMAKRLATRVHPDRQRPRSQQRISGLMALLLMLFLWAGVLAIFYALAELKPLFAAIILLISLGSQPWLYHARLVQHALDKGHKNLARSRIQHWFIRDCQSLSPLGIQKAGAELCVRSQLQVWLGVLFWFALLGPIAAFIYRCCAELTRSWPMNAPHYADFGAVADASFRMLNWIPHHIIRLVLKIINRFSKYKPLTAAAIGMHRQDAELFSESAHYLRADLGGPVLYQGKKLTRTRFNGSQYGSVQPSLKAIMLRLTLLQLLLSIPLITLSLILPH